MLIENEAYFGDMFCVVLRYGIFSGRDLGNVTLGFFKKRVKGYFSSLGSYTAIT